jgi:hypothetical protein
VPLWCSTISRLATRLLGASVQKCVVYVNASTNQRVVGEPPSDYDGKRL